MALNHKIKIERIWHNHEKWEDYHKGMYNSDKARPEMVTKSYVLLANPYKLFCEMVRVSTDWIVSSEFNLSNIASNRRAWLGWASCCNHHGSTDAETRKAWNALDMEQKQKANNVATIVIKSWEKHYYGGLSAKNTVRNERP